MSVSVFSYAGKVSVGFLVDAGLVADPSRWPSPSGATSSH